MNDFQQLWALLRQHGSSAKRETECAALWATYPPDMQQRIYATIRTKLEQGKFVHYDPLRASARDGGERPAFATTDAFLFRVLQTFRYNRRARRMENGEPDGAESDLC